MIINMRGINILPIGLAFAIEINHVGFRNNLYKSDPVPILTITNNIEKKRKYIKLCFR